MEKLDQGPVKTAVESSCGSAVSLEEKMGSSLASTDGSQDNGNGVDRTEPSTVPINLERVLERCTSLPTLPGVALELLEMCRDPNLKFTDLAALIEKDPALSAKILRIVNSPLYGLTREVTTVMRAIVLLGAMSVRTVALSFSLVESFGSNKPGSPSSRFYWQRSLIAAVAAQKIGSLRDVGPPQELFLAGLLQDIGILALSKALRKEYRSLVSDAADHESLIRLEREHLGCEHAAAGAWLVRKWNLPELYESAIRASHLGYQDTCSLAAKPFLLSVALSGIVADIWLASDVQAASEFAFKKTQDLVGFGRSDFDRLLEEIVAILPEISFLFETNFRSQEEIETVMEEARDAILSLSIQTAQRIRHTELAVDDLLRRNSHLQELSLRDALTGLHNRSHLEQVLEQALADGDPISLIMLDVDHFKRVNDLYGHPTGDKVLKQVAKSLEVTISDSDLAVRYGGDEFVVILRNTSSEVTKTVTDRLLQAVRDGAEPSKELPAVSISAGYVTSSSSARFSRVEDLICTADECLYAAKTTGRDRAVGYDETLTN